jgi:hypothetical protein
MAARRYWQAFQQVENNIREILNGENAGERWQTQIAEIGIGNYSHQALPLEY